MPTSQNRDMGHPILWLQFRCGPPARTRPSSPVIELIKSRTTCCENRIRRLIGSQNSWHKAVPLHFLTISHLLKPSTPDGFDAGHSRLAYLFDRHSGSSGLQLHYISGLKTHLSFSYSVT